MVPARLPRRRVLFGGVTVALRLRKVNDNENKDQKRAARSYQVRKQERISVFRRRSDGSAAGLFSTLIESHRLCHTYDRSIDLKP